MKHVDQSKTNKKSKCNENFIIVVNYVKIKLFVRYLFILYIENVVFPGRSEVNSQIFSININEYFVTL